MSNPYDPINWDFFSPYKHDILNMLKKHEPDLNNHSYIDQHVDFYAWTQAGGSSPFGVCGQTVNSFQVYAFVGHNLDCVLLLCGKLKYHNRFQFGMNFFTGK